jgi:hypothetical protein
VAFYDHRRAPPGTDPLKTTDYWLRSSHTGGASWKEQHVASPFDQITAPNSFIGDYWGVAAIPGGFGLSYILAQPAAATPPTDVFFSTATS